MPGLLLAGERIAFRKFAVTMISDGRRRTSVGVLGDFLLSFGPPLLFPTNI
jgi:hypothetical protein